MMKNADITKISNTVIQPYYKAKMELAVAAFDEFFAGSEAFIHKPEGAMFLWMWFPALSITNQELYEYLKTEGVLIVSGHYFFPGLNDEWEHKNQCIRISYSQDEADVRKGLKIIAETIKKFSA
ncbi:MAG: hypothetical protein HRT89_05250 [Lentisphaeria bacterium]|nr:hypothetical protein [Lentisphaeria bacterium]